MRSCSSSPGAALFLTWHLHTSLPASVLPPPRSLASGQAFVWLDRQLDTLRRGPRYLHRPDIAQIVVNSIHKGVELEHYELGAYVVMPNHLHLLIRPSIAPERLMKSLKGASARERPTVCWDEPASRFGRRNPTITGWGVRASSKTFGCTSRPIQ